ncbi:MAG: hypothetical protein AAGN35_21180 [Bacteroidota bacterium]
MNLYFLLEGKRTEPKVYPNWLKVLLPQYSRVAVADEARANNYYMILGFGYPSLSSCISAKMKFTKKILPRD